MGGGAEGAGGGGSDERVIVAHLGWRLILLLRWRMIFLHVSLLSSTLETILFYCRYARTRLLPLVCPDPPVTLSMPGPACYPQYARTKRVSDTGHKALCPVSHVQTSAVPIYARRSDLKFSSCSGSLSTTAPRTRWLFAYRSIPKNAPGQISMPAESSKNNAEFSSDARETAATRGGRPG